MEGIERLETEVAEINNAYISAIFKYLKTRKDLYEKFNNEEKSISQMYKFIYEKADKQKIGTVAMIDDRVVYLWAVTYFCKTNKELGIEEKKVMPPSVKEVAKKLEEKAKEKEKTEANKKENKNQISMFQEVQE